MNHRLREEYQKIINDVETRLKQDEKWKAYYAELIDKLNNPTLKEKVNEAFSRARTRKGLQKNLQINKAKRTSIKKPRIEVDLKYNGIHVGSMVIDATQPHQNDVMLKIECERGAFVSDNVYMLADSKDKSFIPWNNPRAKEWRSIFNEDFLWKERPEAALESYLNRNLQKVIKHSAPIQYEDRFVFQMPTPIGGNDLKEEGNTSSDTKSGHIDLMARIGLGRNKLAVLELKDEYKDKERPELAIKQAISYAAFIHSLLRSKNTNAEAWYKSFGFKGNIPSSLSIKAIVVMPEPENKEPDLGFAEIKELVFEGFPNDSIELGCALLTRNGKDWELKKKTW